MGGGGGGGGDTPAEASHQKESHKEVEDCIDCVQNQTLKMLTLKQQNLCIMQVAL